MSEKLKIWLESKQNEGFDFIAKVEYPGGHLCVVNPEAENRMLFDVTSLKPYIGCPTEKYLDGNLIEEGTLFSVTIVRQISAVTDDRPILCSEDTVEDDAYAIIDICEDVPNFHEEVDENDIGAREFTDAEIMQNDKLETMVHYFLMDLAKTKNPNQTLSWDMAAIGPVLDEAERVLRETHNVKIYRPYRSEE